MRKILLFITLSVFVIPASAQLNGQYSVDASSPATTTNYQSVNAAVSDLTNGTRSDGGPVNGPGVSGPVTIRLTTGTGPYVEQVTFTAITGASAVNTIRLTGGPGREVITFSAATTADRQVVKINGARHIILDSLTLINTGATYGYGVHITNSADSNVVSNCSVITNNTSTSANFAGITISGTTVATAGDHGDDNLIQNNNVNGGYYGITMRGTSTTVFNQRNKVIGNTIQNFYYYGVYCYHQNLTEIKQNLITARTGATASGYGIYLNYVDLFAIEGNTMYNLGGNGIYGSSANYQGGTGSGRARIVNNMIGGGWIDLTSAYGIYLLTNPRNIDIFHNSISMNMGTGPRALYMTGGTGNNVQNNSLSVTGSTTGYAMYISSVAYVTTVDYNNYYAPGSSNFIYIGVAYNTSTYIGGGGFNTNSRNGDPVYQGATNLHTSALQLYDAGTNVGVTTDIDGDARPMAPTSIYDIGADEFVQVLNDAGVTAMTNPTTPFAAGVHNVDVTLFNFGSATLTNVTVNWDVNTVLQAPFAWTGSVPTYTASAPVTIGTYNFLAGNTYDLRIWTSNPNSVADQQITNDTLSVSVCVGLSGVYTIGGVGADYATINDAVAALVCGGAAGPVTMNLTQGAGPFNEQVIIPAIAGASSTRPIRFNGGANRETVQFNATLTGERAVIKLDGADHVILDSLTITNTGATYGYGVQLLNSADSNTVKNCIVSVNATATGTNFAGITLSSATVATNGDHGDNNLIQDNVVSGGYYGITMRGTGTTVFNQRNKVIGNTIENFYYYGVYCYYQNLTEIKANTITARGAATASGYGIYLNYVDLFAVERNTMYNLGGNGIYGASANYQGGTGSGRASITNNMIGGGWVDATSPYGIYLLTNPRNIDLFHNSISMNTGTAARGLYMTGGTGNDIRNNSIAVFGSTTGYAMYISSAAYVTTVDYNNYYAPGSSNFIYLGTAYNTSTYVGGGGFNTNSRDGDPYYINNASDLHSYAAQLYDAGTNAGINVDIDGDVRPLAPSVGYDIGADEYGVVTDDNAVLQIYSPINNSCSDSNTVISVIITNLGSDPITSMSLTALVTGYTSATVNGSYTGNLLFGEVDTVAIGTFNSFPGGMLNIVAYSTLPGDQNIGNDTVSATVQITPLAAAATGANDTGCVGSAATVFVNADGFAHYWYDASTGGNLLAGGDTFTTPVLSSSTTYYVESLSSSTGNLTTTFAGGNGCDGAMFDIVPAVNMTIDSFAVNIGSTVSENVRVFVCPTGTYVGNETNPGAWVQIGLVSVIAQGAGQPTMIPIGNIPMIAGQTYGVYVILTSANMDYTNGSQSYTNGEMTINTGAGTCGPFATVNAGRMFNGTVYYTKEVCANPVRTPISVTVLNPPVVSLGNDTAVCETFVLDAGNAGLNYLWSTMQTTQQITVTASGPYFVDVSDAYCTGSDTINLSVNPNPVLITTVADGMLCLGESDTLTVSGAMLYTWSSGGVGTTEIVTPTITTVYTVYGLDANGCTDTDTLVVVVNQPPVVTVALPLDTACLNGGPVTLSGESPVGGTWSGTGVSGNSFDPIVAGIGTTVITYDYTDANGCFGSTTDSIWVDLCSGIAASANGESVSVYPNPNNGVFTLSVNDTEPVTVIIYDALGRVVITEQFVPGIHPVQINGAGVYTITIVDRAGVRTVRTVVVE